MNSRVEKQRKALAELEAQLVLASPHLLFQVNDGDNCDDGDDDDNCDGDDGDLDDDDNAKHQVAAG